MIDLAEKSQSQESLKVNAHRERFIKKISDLSYCQIFMRSILNTKISVLRKLSLYLSRIKTLLKKKHGSAGSVLIEFAFCCPVLIILLFFVLDVPLAYRVTLKMQKMSELTANMIRNVPAQPLAVITLNDLKNISAAVGITITGKLGSSSKPQVNYPFFLSTYVFCIAGNSTGGFDRKWIVHVKNNLYNGNIVVNSDDVALTYSQFKNASDFSTIRELSGFKIQKGEVKLVVETVAWYNTDGSGITAFADYGVNKLQNLFNNSVNSTWLALFGLPQDVMGDSARPGNSNDLVDMIGIAKKNQLTEIQKRGFNKGFYLMTIPGRNVSTGVKAFGNRFTIMSNVDEIVDVENGPK